MTLWLALVLIFVAGLVGFVWGARLMDWKWSEFFEDYKGRERRAQMTRLD